MDMLFDRFCGKIKYAVIALAALMAVFLAFTAGKGVAAFFDTGEADAQEPPKWSFAVPVNDSDDSRAEGFAVRVVWKDGKPEFSYYGNCAEAWDLHISDKAVSFKNVAWDGASGTPAELAILETQSLAVFDVARDNIPSQGRENTPQLREQLAKLFSVTYCGEPVQGGLMIGRGNGHTDFSFDFDTPLGTPRDGDVMFLAVGTEEWVSLSKNAVGLFHQGEQA